MNYAFTQDTVKAVDAALDAKYKYGLSSDPTSFGARANLASARAAYETLHIDPSAKEDVIAEAIHKGWASVAREDNADVSSLTPPHKKAARLVLADTPYNELPVIEKEKDLVIARTIQKLMTPEP